MSLFARHKLLSTRVRQSLLRVGVGVLTVSTALGGLAFADDNGGGHNDTPDGGNNKFTSKVLWKTDDNFGPANGATVTDVLTRVMGGNLTDKQTSPQTIEATITVARNECETKYANRHNGDRNANCRVFAVGAVMSTPGNWVVGASGKHSQNEWMTAWSDEVLNRTYTHNGFAYNTAKADSTGTSINDLAQRETASGDTTNLVVIVGLYSSR